MAKLKEELKAPARTDFACSAPPHGATSLHQNCKPQTRCLPAPYRNVFFILFLPSNPKKKSTGLQANRLTPIIPETATPTHATIDKLSAKTSRFSLRRRGAIFTMPLMFL
jgi:hypothetical protein